ncbi:hypothetical protein ACHQM5_024453 [Ranunculus cassubicifolius]
MVALPPLEDSVVLNLHIPENPDSDSVVEVDMKVRRRREPLRVVHMWKTVNSGQQSDGIGVLTRLIRSSNPNNPNPNTTASDDGFFGFAEHWRTVTVISLCGCSLSVLPPELTTLALVEKLYLENNKLSFLPP